jgi:hypothetical protein
MLKDNSGNVIIAQFCYFEQQGFYNLVVTCDGNTGAYVSDGCDPSGENLGFDEISGLHHPGNITGWIERADIMWKSFIETGMVYSKELT